MFGDVYGRTLTILCNNAFLLIICPKLNPGKRSLKPLSLESTLAKYLIKKSKVIQTVNLRIITFLMPNFQSNICVDPT